MATVTLSLISHTNVGKTTLARTLLRRDVGEVLDQAHVTEISEAHTLIEADGHRLELWDTPGFGHLGRLMKRLGQESNPIGWFLHQVWDRAVNRPLWCSQEAVRNIKEHADVVLYLVNASEEPEHAGYVPPELDLLTWMDRPVLLLLNQVGVEGESLVEGWRRFVGRWPIVREVLALDAFTRCWIEEAGLLERVARVLEGPKREAMETLTRAWNERNRAAFLDSCDSLARYITETALDREEADRTAGEEDSERGTLELLKDAFKFSAVNKHRAMDALSKRLDARTATLMEHLIVVHGLFGDSAATIERRVQDFQVRGLVPFDERSGALAGAVVSGAVGGLAADALSGGLSLGGGMIAGGILGALGGSALAKGYRVIGGRKNPSVTWTPGFLHRLCHQAMLRYLAIAHFGRGRGGYRDLEQPAHWSEAVERALDARRSVLEGIRDDADKPGERTAERINARLRTVIEDGLREVLHDAYPGAGGL
jgi:hypothetical protein